MEIELGRTYRALGDIMEQKSEIPQMIHEYGRSLQLYEQLAAADPANATVQDELARAFETLGDGLSRTANPAAARLTNYQKALAIREGLLRQEKSSAKLQRSVALTLTKVAGVTPHQPEAIAAMRRAAPMLESLAAANPNDGRAYREVGWGYYQLGNVLMAAGDYAGALASRRKAFSIRDQLAANDPQNAQVRFDLAVAHADLAEALTASSDPAAAAEHARQGLAILEGLAAADPTNAVYSRNVALCDEKLGEAFAHSGAETSASIARRIRDWSEARGFYRTAGAIFARLGAHGALTPADAKQPDTFAGRSADCERAIAQLRAANGSH